MIIPLLIIVVCLFLNALFSCAEMAFVSVNKGQIRRASESGNHKARLIEKMHKSPERILSVVQIGITLVAAISAAVSGSLAQEFISPWLREAFDASEELAESVAIAMVVVPITFLTVLIGELVPKSMAIKLPYRISLLLAPGLRLAEKTLGLLVTPLEKMTNFLVEFIFHPRRKKESEEDSQISLRDLKKEHKEFVHNVIDLDVRRAKRAMVSWNKVRWIESDASATQLLDTFLHSGFSRLVVLKQGRVLGFIHLKDFLQVMQLKAQEHWPRYIRPIVFISSNLKLINALRLMKANKVQILLVGRPESPEGIVTLEDLIEEVVGDVEEAQDKRIVGYLRHTVIKNNPRSSAH